MVRLNPTDVQEKPVIMSSDERTFGTYLHAMEAQTGPEVSCRAFRMPWDGCPTDGAVLAVPAGAAFTLAIAAGPVLCATRVAGPLVARGPHPAVLTAAGASYADAMATTVSSTDLCGQERGAEGQGWEEREQKLIEPVVAGNKGHTWPPS